MKKKTSYLLRFCKTNSRPLLKKNTYLLQKKEVLIEKLKTVLPAVILKKKSWPPTSQNFKTHKTFVVQRFLLHTYTSTVCFMISTPPLEVLADKKGGVGGTYLNTAKN